MWVNAQADARGLAVRDGPKTKLTPNRSRNIAAPATHFNSGGTMDTDQIVFFIVVSAVIVALIWGLAGKPVRGKS